jgi:hypothetical protein
MNQQTINNQNIFAIIINFFTADNWQFQQIESESVLQMAFQGKHGKWNCYAQYKDEQQQFIFYSIYPLTTPETQRLATSEFIARVNYGLTIGNFELDFRDSDVFVQAFNFFSQNKFSVKNLKLIQRYASIAGKAKLFLQQLEQYRESSDNSELNLAKEDLETLFWHTNQSLSELPTDKLLGEKELKYLIEIEQLREELLSYERLLKQINSLDIKY